MFWDLKVPQNVECDIPTFVENVTLNL